MLAIRQEPASLYRRRNTSPSSTFHAAVKHHFRVARYQIRDELVCACSLPVAVCGRWYALATTVARL